MLKPLLASLIALVLVGTLPPWWSAAQSDVVVELRDNDFVPATVRVEPGASVTWINRGRNAHDVVSDDGSFASPLLQPGDRFTLRFAKPGVYPYFCSPHGARGGHGMAALVLVGDEAAGYRRGEYGRTGSATRTYPERPPRRPAGGGVIRVPADAPTIQAAVDRARPGDVVLVAPGVYHEAVKVTTSHLTIRGEDRNGVILDGRFDPTMKNGVAVFGADGVALENMTARHYQQNGFYWRSAWGYRGSYLTAYNNGDYGLYAFDSGVGQFDHSYASGHPDSGFYIGQCDPCNALITDVVARNNAIGYSGTNASGRLVIRDSEWVENMAGIVPNTLDSEALAPQRGVTIVGNLVRANHNRSAPVKPRLYALFGSGIILLGGNGNEVAFNRVEDHAYVGIAVAPSIDDNLWIGGANRIHDNVVGASGLADLALIAPSGSHNCFARNAARTTLPPALESAYACGAPLAALGGGDVGLLLNGLGLYLRSLDVLDPDAWKRQPAPPPQPSMPDANAVPPPAGPEPLDVEGEVASAASTVATAAAVPSPVVGNIALALYSYGIPLLFLAAVAQVLLRLRRIPWLTGKGALLGLPLAYVVLGVAILVLAYLR